MDTPYSYARISKYLDYENATKNGILKITWKDLAWNMKNAKIDRKPNATHAERARALSLSEWNWLVCDE